MEIDTLSLDEIIQLAGKVKDWVKLPKGHSKSPTGPYNPLEMERDIQSYEGIIESVSIIVAHYHCKQVLGKLSPIRIPGVDPYSVHHHSFDSFGVSATLGNIHLGRYNSHKNVDDYLHPVFRPDNIDSEGVLKNLYNQVEATYKRSQQEKQEMAETSALRKARALLG